MREINEKAKIDVKNKMYLRFDMFSNCENIYNISVLKHCSFIDSNSKITHKWRWISIEGREFFNVLIPYENFDMLGSHYLFRDTPEECFEFVSKSVSMYIEVDGVLDLLDEWDAIKQLLHSILMKD